METVFYMHQLHWNPDSLTICLSPFLVFSQIPWTSPQPLYIQVISRMPSPFTAPRCKSRKSTRSMTAGMWPVSSSFCSSSSLSCRWLPWLCSTSYWTVGAVPKGRHTTSYSRRGREAAANSWPASARSQSPTLRWYRRSNDECKGRVEIGVWLLNWAVSECWHRPMAY